MLQTTMEPSRLLLKESFGNDKATALLTRGFFVSYTTPPNTAINRVSPVCVERGACCAIMGESRKVMNEQTKMDTDKSQARRDSRMV